MKREKIIKILFLVLDLFVFSMVTYVIVKAVFFGYRFGDIVVPPYEFSYFQYFTNLSNILAGLVSLYLFIYTLIHFKDDKPLPKWLSLLELAASTGVGLTFITVVVFLAPMQVINGGNYFIMFSDDLLFTHALNPIAACIVFMFLNKHEKISLKEALYGVIPMGLYSIVYSSLVLSNVWPDFYGFTFGGKYWLIALVLPIMFCVTYLISFVISIPTRRKQK